MPVESKPSGKSAKMRKAAVLLMSLPQEIAAQVLAKLRPQQIEAVSIEIARLGVVGGEEQTAVIQEFAETNPARRGVGIGRT